ncbi:MAG: TonB-dependent receptor SusC [Candidatus Ordinivivax streblomastigis]|uniref:TonB-dependent receptor SusC n=1 Tax=Candidatus Ordinivivax streblomastigis TaxID=2540710 RepID=A0A5M8NY87_9BACT|nr:MAG: TonB-dependent receptor SusC [Candidatus Ordinivivax streblomastigis]
MTEQSKVGNENEKQDNPSETKSISIKGTVRDEKGEPLIGVNVYVKANALRGTVTDENGVFSMTNIPEKSIIVFSYISMTNVEMNISGKSAAELQRLDVVMKEESGALEEVIVTATGSQKRVSVVGAITTINPIELKAPTRSLTNQLAGRVAGVTFIQGTGQPGKDGASFIIRGINSVGGSHEPLILIDGMKRTLDDVDPNDIESFSVLKDASATAVYGLEGANGIIVITTKNGKISEKPNIRVSYSSSINNSTYKPDWVDAVNYAKMRNEALVVRGKNPEYTDEMINLFMDDNMDEYPNVDWYNTLYKQNNFSQKANFNISGGGNVVTYYASGGFYTENGMFRGNIAEYDSNANYSEFNFRSNLKADITQTTTLGIGLDGRYGTTTEPGQSSDYILQLSNRINPTLYPPQYSNGTAPEEPDGLLNPFSQLNRTGFARYYQNTMSANVNLTQKLDMITPGLFFTALASFTKVNNYRHRYVKNYQRYRIDYTNSYMHSGRDEEGNLLTISVPPVVDEKMSFEKQEPSGNRLIEVQSSLNYSRRFINDKLFLTGLMLYKQRERLEDNPSGSGGTLLINALPSREQSLAGRIAFDWASKYFMDINFGGSGSQMFTPDKRWSYFPSIGAGWLASGEDFWEPIEQVIDFLKLRASYGIVGSTGNASRFAYMATTSGKTGYTFGFGGTAYSGTSISGIGEDRLEQLGLTWEKNKKTDLGLEFGLFNQVKVIFDVYENHRIGQLINLNRLPATLGLPSTPKANLGEMVSNGFDLDITYAKKWNNFSINYIKAILSYNDNKTIENGEMDPKVPYLSGIGYNWGRDLKYIALGLFKDQTDIDNSPVQTWNTVMPGDIKYKDINGDGVISGDDRIWVGGIYPKWTYSFAIDFGYKNWIISGRIIGKSNMFRSIEDRVPFRTSDGYQAAIYPASVNNHWTPESYSGTPATERADAIYPRLGIGTDNNNNTQASTFWLREASYWRLADVEIGYNWIPKSVNLPFRSIYFYGRGENLHTFSKFKDWNPEQTSSWAYPLKMTISLGLEIGFKL